MGNLIHKFKRVYSYIYHTVMYIVFSVIGFFAKKIFGKYRNVWLISERGREARDNAYHFFKYIRMQHPQIKAYYVADKNNSDYKKIENLGNIAQYGSLLHYLLFIVSDFKISTHIMGCAPDMVFYHKLDKLFKIKGKNIFLGHGITKDTVPWMMADNARLDLFVCGAKREYEFVKSTYGYKDNVVQYLGLCRYDALNTPHTVKKQVLIMPTWRSYLQHDTAKEFVESQYYKAYTELINDPNIIAAAKKYGYELIFYPHHEMQRYLGLFSVKSAVVKMASVDEYDVQQLLKESALLITDYSSVPFDFAYMKKPVIYYQFDSEMFFNMHYGRGYFDYVRDGFGEVFTSENELSKAVCKMLETGALLPDKYKKRIDEFFEIHDYNNCERTYRAIEKLREV